MNKRKSICLFTKQELKKLILLCKKGVHVTLCGESYIQTDGVAMCSPLGIALCGIFMAELENTLVPTLSDHLVSWKRCIDDTNSFIKEGLKRHVISVLNSFQLSFQFIDFHFLNSSLLVMNKTLRYVL